MPQHAIAVRRCWEFALEGLIQINRMRTDPWIVIGASARDATRSHGMLVLFREPRQKGVQAPGFFKVLSDAVLLEHEDDLLPLSPTSFSVELFRLNVGLSIRNRTSW